MIATKYKFIIREFKNDYHTSNASKLIALYDWWLNSKVKTFSLQNNFLTPSPYDLGTEENDANFLIPNKESPPYYIPEILPIQRT